MIADRPEQVDLDVADVLGIDADVVRPTAGSIPPPHKSLRRIMWVSPLVLVACALSWAIVELTVSPRGLQASPSAAPLSHEGGARHGVAGTDPRVDLLLNGSGLPPAQVAQDATVIPSEAASGRAKAQRSTRSGSKFITDQRVQTSRRSDRLRPSSLAYAALERPRHGASGSSYEDSRRRSLELQAPAWAGAQIVSARPDLSLEARRVERRDAISAIRDLRQQ